LEGAEVAAGLGLVVGGAGAEAGLAPGQGPDPVTETVTGGGHVTGRTAHALPAGTGRGPLRASAQRAGTKGRGQGPVTVERTKIEIAEARAGLSPLARKANPGANLGASHVTRSLCHGMVTVGLVRPRLVTSPALDLRPARNVTDCHVARCSLVTL